MTNLIIKNELEKRQETFNKIFSCQKKSSKFIIDFLNIVYNNEYLSKCSTKDLMLCALDSASLNLDLNPKLGYIYIIPFKGKPQLQVGYKGMLKFLLNSKQVVDFNFCKVSENQVDDIDLITGKIELNKEHFKDDAYLYIFYIELQNGFKKAFFMTKNEIVEHAKKYSQSYNSKFSPWNTDFDSMAYKTVFKKYSKLLPQSTEITELSSINGKVYNSEDDTNLKNLEPQEINHNTLDLLATLEEQGVQND